MARTKKSPRPPPDGAAALLEAALACERRDAAQGYAIHIKPVCWEPGP